MINKTFFMNFLTTILVSKKIVYNEVFIVIIFSDGHLKKAVIESATSGIEYDDIPIAPGKNPREQNPKSDRRISTGQTEKYDNLSISM